jgi:hypothetical protein
MSLFKKKVKIQTFTYFLPTPPQRKRGFREKEFDNLFAKIVDSDHQLLEMHTEQNDSGMWIILVLKGPVDSFIDIRNEEIDNIIDQFEL